MTKYQRIYCAITAALSAANLVVVALAVIGSRKRYSITDPHEFAQFISKRDKALLDRLRDYDARKEKT